MNSKKQYESPEILLMELLDNDILTESNDIGKDEGENDGEWS